jgi:hypothetical protein
MSEEHTEEHSEEYMEIVHSEEKEKAHLDVMLIWTMLEARITINQQVDWSAPSEEQSTGDREI